MLGAAQGEDVAVEQLDREVFLVYVLIRCDGPSTAGDVEILYTHVESLRWEHDSVFTDLLQVCN